jgi:ATP-dependent helicase/nuclease subunit B
VLEWLVTRPPATTSAQGDPLPDVPVSVWDRLSRRAQVLEGPEQWIARFERLIRTLEVEERERDDWRVEAHAHEAEADTPRPARDSDHARAIVAAVRLLEHDTRPPAEPATWDALVEWASGLRSSYVPDDPTWPESEHAASAALDGALDSLRAASALEPTTTVAVFTDSLAAALEERRLDEGQPGVGVLVGPLGSSTGAAFERVYVLGMAEGLLPGRPPTDPLLPTAGSTDPLRRRDRQRQADRRALLASVSSADGHTVLLSFARSDGAARASYPSRWLLEQAAQLEGVPALYAADLPRLIGPDHPWMERIASAYDGLQRCSTPLNLADLRLHAVVKWHASGRRLAHHALADRSDLSIGRALRAAGARRSRQFTEFDGNLRAIAAESRRIGRPFAADGGASSATSLERWAGCPFLYFMVNVLRVEATERPEDEWTVTPLDKGSLVHAVLEQFFRERFEPESSRPHGAFTADDRDRLDEIAEKHLRDLEDQGRTGHPLAWDNARAVIVKDLHVLLEREDAWRTQDGLEPALFERTFGDSRDPDTWPAVVVPLEDGLEVRFRGAMDRVDFSPTGADRRGPW